MKKLLFLLLVGALLAVQPCEAKKKVVRKKAKTTKTVKAKPDAKVTCPPENVESSIDALVSDVAHSNCDDKEEIFKSVEQMPQFPGGDGALLDFIASNLHYPAMAQEQGIQGVVVAKFVVTKTGKIGNVEIVRSLSLDCDNEVIRVIKLLPDFTPGYQHGEAVNVWYTLPMTFKLQK